MRKLILLYSISLFIIPAITLLICYQIHVIYYDLTSIHFIDGEVSVSLIGRQEYTIWVFRLGLFLYALTSVLFYFKISNFFYSIGAKNKFKALSILANFSLCVYLIALGKQESFYEVLRRLSIIFFIASMYINHIYLIRMLRFLKLEKKIQFSNVYLLIFYTIILLMTVLVMIGLPWVNPLFKYPDQLKNIIEWNLLFLTIFFYIPLSQIVKKF